MFVIVTEFAFFQMEQESFSGNAVEFSQSSFGEAPEVFNAVDMGSLSV